MNTQDLSFTRYRQMWREYWSLAIVVAAFTAWVSLTWPALSGIVYQATAILQVGRPVAANEPDGVARFIREETPLQDVAKRPSRPPEAIRALMTVDAGGKLLRVNVRSTDPEEALIAARLFADYYIFATLQVLNAPESDLPTFGSIPPRLVSVGVKPIFPSPVWFHQWLVAMTFGWLAAALVLYLLAMMDRVKLKI